MVFLLTVAARRASSAGKIVPGLARLPRPSGEAGRRGCVRTVARAGWSSRGLGRVMDILELVNQVPEEVDVFSTFADKIHGELAHVRMVKAID